MLQVGGGPYEREEKEGQITQWNADSFLKKSLLCFSGYFVLKERERIFCSKRVLEG